MYCLDGSISLKPTCLVPLFALLFSSPRRSTLTLHHEVLAALNKPAIFVCAFSIEGARKMFISLSFSRVIHKSHCDHSEEMGKKINGKHNTHSQGPWNIFFSVISLEPWFRENEHWHTLTHKHSQRVKTQLFSLRLVNNQLLCVVTFLNKAFSSTRTGREWHKKSIIHKLEASRKRTCPRLHRHTHKPPYLAHNYTAACGCTSLADSVYKLRQRYDLARSCS